MTRTSRSLIGAAVAAFAFTVAACADSATAPIETAGIHLNGLAGEIFSAAGDPTFDANAIVPATFAVAMIDSTGGIVIAAYNQVDGEPYGDAFFLQLTEDRLGAFEACAPAGPDCHGRLIRDITAPSTLQWERWEIKGGRVVVEEKGTQLVGSVEAMVLELDGTPPQTITGTFSLPLLTGDEARAMLTCFVTTASGGTCS